jgi:hypothetical protein
MSGFGFSLLGAGPLEKRIKDYAKSIQDDVAAEIEDSVANIRDKALRRAPNSGGFRKGIGSKMLGRYEGEITSNSKVSAYVEFGTGVYAANYVPSLPPEIQEYARTFYVNGKGTLPATPFLFNSFLEERVELIKRIKEILKNG